MKSGRVYKAKLINSKEEVLLIYNNKKFSGAIYITNDGVKDFSRIIYDIAPPTENDFPEYNIRFKDRIHYEISKVDISNITN